MRIALICVLFSTSLYADYREFTAVTRDPFLQSVVRRATEESLKDLPKLKAEDLAVTLVDVSNPSIPGRADVNGDVNFYPASVIKLFFMADIFMQKKQTLGDVDRALKEMIVVSDNDAAAYLLDILTKTTGVTQLEGRALNRYIDQRRDINRHFQRIGYDISAMMKPWSFAPYGRELQVLGKNRVNRNRLTSNATAALLLWIARGRAPGAQAMKSLLERPLNPAREDENQVKEFIGEALPAGSRLWSKAGWTSEVRHDAAYVELPSGRKLIMVIFTRGQASDLTIIPVVTRNILEELQLPSEVR